MEVPPSLVFHRPGAMQLLLILAVAASLAISEAAPQQPLGGEAWRTFWALVGMASIAGFAAASAGMVSLGLRYETDRRALWLTRFQRLRTMHTSLWLLVTAVILYGLGWPQLVRFNWRWADVFLGDELLILAPAIVPLVLSWAAFFEIEKVLAPAEDAAPSRGEYLWFHARHELGLLLVPVLVLLAVRDAAQCWAPELLSEQAAPRLLIPTLAALFLFFPFILRVLWPTEPLPAGELRTRLEAAADRLQVRVREILLWQTQGRAANAVVTGLFAPLRHVLLTDALVRAFTPDEVELIFAHEAAHLRKQHLLARLLALLAPILAYALWQTACPEWVALASARLAQFGLAPVWQGPLLLVSGLGVYGLSFFARYSRLLEHEADLDACAGSDPAPLIAALEKLAAVNGLPLNARTWLHPSIAERIAFLAAHVPDPAARRRFNRRNDLLRTGLYLYTLAALTLLLPYFLPT